MEKFEVRICRCGHIHLFSEAAISAAFAQNKKFVIVCGSCGCVTVLGANSYIDEHGNKIYDCYSYDADTTYEANMAIHSSDAVINYRRGMEIPMMSGHSANQFFRGRFYDNSSPRFDELLDLRSKIDRKAVEAFVQQYETDRASVDMKQLIRDNTPEVLEALSKLSIEQFNWVSTPYEQKSDSCS